eukprot:jgi/Psemu1/27319/gm1.27319_g
MSSSLLPSLSFVVPAPSLPGKGRRDATGDAKGGEAADTSKWLAQCHTFDQIEGVFRTVLCNLKDPARDKGLSPVNNNVHDVEEHYPELNFPAASALDLEDPAKLKTAFTALVKQLKDFQTHLMQTEMKVEELELSYVNLQLAAITLIIRQQNGDYNSSTLMEANTMFANNLAKLKAQPAALPKDNQDKRMKHWRQIVRQDYKARSNRCKTCNTCPRPSGFNSLSLTSSPKPAVTANLQVRRKALDAQVTLLKEESNTTKIHLVNMSFTSCLDMGGTDSNASFESFTRKSGYSSPNAVLVMKSFRYPVLEVFMGDKGSYNACAEPTRISKNPIPLPAKKIGDTSAIACGGLTGDEQVSDNAGLPVGKASNTRIHTRWLFQPLCHTNSPQQAHVPQSHHAQDEMNTHLTAALKKEQEDRQVSEEGLTTPAWTSLGPEKATPSFSPGTDSQQELKTNDGQSLCTHTTRLNYNLTKPWPTCIYRSGYQRNIRTQQTGTSTGLQPQLLLLFFAFGLSQLNSQFQKKINKTGSTCFFHAKRGGITDGWLLELCKRMVTMVKKEETDRQDMMNQICDECVLDLLIDHETPGKVLTGVIWFLGYDQTGSTPPREKQRTSPLSAVQVISRTHMATTPSLYNKGVLEVDLESTLGEEILKAKNKDWAGAITDKATKSNNDTVANHNCWNRKIAAALKLQWSGLRTTNRNRETRFASNGHLEQGYANSACLTAGSRNLKAWCDKADNCSWWNWDKGSSIFVILPDATTSTNKEGSDLLMGVLVCVQNNKWIFGDATTTINKQDQHVNNQQRASAEESDNVHVHVDVDVDVDVNIDANDPILFFEAK